MCQKTRNYVYLDCIRVTVKIFSLVGAGTGSYYTSHIRSKYCDTNFNDIKYTMSHAGLPIYPARVNDEPHFSHDKPHLETITLYRDSATAQVSLFGAHVLHFCPKENSGLRATF